MRQRSPGPGESWRAAAAALALACSASDTTHVDPTEPSSAAAEAGCPEWQSPSIGRETSALSVVDRSLVGSPTHHVADPTLRAREPELMRSQRARRAAAWELAARVLAPVALPAELGAPAAELRTWQTWHNEDDLTRIFRRLYAELTPEERARRAPFSADRIAEAWRWNDGAISDFESWSAERLAEYRRAIDSAPEVAGLGGIARVAHAPATSQHWLESYAEVLACRRSEAAPEPELVPLEASPSGCDPEPPFQSACLAGQFAPESVLVKASWARLDAGGPLYAFDTSAASLADKLSAAQGFDWGPGDRIASPGEGEMYTVQLPNGNRFGLTGLHIMSKELEHWFWVTLWWSDDPNEDFGADRPAGIGAPFDHYKLCSVVWFDEGDAADGGFAHDTPSLAAALAATASGPGAPTWCSNPYIERGAGNAATNCIGCHQHAGTALSTEQVLAAHDPASGTGRRRSRSSFPADYVFALRQGDDIGAMFVETEDHSAPDPASP